MRGKAQAPIPTTLWQVVGSKRGIIGRGVARGGRGRGKEEWGLDGVGEKATTRLAYVLFF